MKELNNTYLALTIGPIYKTMKLARKTREFWAASMLFSLLSKELCEQLKAQGVKEDDFLVPHPDVFKWKMKDIGLYLDRIICRANPEIWKDFEQTIIDESLKKLSEKVCKVVDKLTPEVLKSYFKIYAVIKEVEDGKPAIADISDHLNTLELYNTEISDSKVDHLIKEFMENVNTEYDDAGNVEGSDNFLKQHFTYPDYKGNKRVPSIVEISTKSLDKKHSEIRKAVFEATLWKRMPNENNMFEMLKDKIECGVKNYNKYICILQADGDKLGRALMEMNAGDIVKISKDLIEWGRDDALRLLKEYDALPIYIGGDDVLCFAPVNNGNKNILELAADLNKTYRNRPAIKAIGSTLSIGIKIAYYKSPMYESYLDTFTLLNELAKKHEFITESKKASANSCCISLEKHSGQPHQFIFNFEHEYCQFIKPIFDNMIAEETKKSFITSVFYKLRANEDLIEHVSHDEDRIWYFFENNFDEANIRKKDLPEFNYLKAICKYLFYLFGKYGNEKIENQDLFIATNELYSTLKTIRFIKGLDYDNE